MKITVYLGSFLGKEKIYSEAVKALGNWIGENGHELVYGGSHAGLMGLLCDGVVEKGGRVTAVQPGFLIEKAGLHEGVAELFETNDMSERKAKMIELGDAFIAFPGGVGTLEEISEIMSHRGLDLIRKPCIIYNVNGYYDYLEKMLDHMTSEGFLPEENRAKIVFIKGLDELDSIL